MPLPVLSEAQRHALNFAVDYWHTHSSWPERVDVMASLRAKGFDPKRTLEEEFGDLITSRGYGPVELTLFGVAATHGGEPWAAPLIPLLRRAVDVFLANPRTRPQVTSQDLRELAPSWTAEQLHRVGPLLRDELMSCCGGGGSTLQDGTWQVDVTARCLRFRQAEALSGCLDLKHRRVGRQPEFGSLHRQMAMWIVARWRESAQGPDALDTVLNHLQFPDPVEIFEELPEGLFGPATLHNGGPVEPRMRALITLRPHTDQDLGILVKLLCAVHDLSFTPTGFASPSVEQVASRAGVEAAQAIRLLSVAESIYRAGVRLHLRGEDYEIRVDEDAFDLETVRSVEDLVSWVGTREKDLARWTDAPPEMVSEKDDHDASLEPEGDPSAKIRAAFRALELHPVIRRAASDLFADEHYRNAVLDASVALVGLVKQKSNRHDLDGANLMRTVFSRTNPTLAFNARSDQSELDEQEGLMHLFEGAVLALRNPRAHALVPDSPEFALEYIAILSLLAKRLDAAKRKES